MGKGNKDVKEGFFGAAGEWLKLAAMTLAIFAFVKGTIAEARYIPSTSMLPTLSINDRILIDKLSIRMLPIKRGDILVFYPPTIETGVPDSALAPLTRLIPLLPENPPAFIKRVVGLPGDRIVVKSGQGVYLNGKFLNESKYVNEAPLYSLTAEHDIGGMAMTGKYIKPYAESDKEIVVPEGHLFMLGDNRNDSADSHVWGCLDQSRVVGRACMTFWKGSWLN